MPEWMLKTTLDYVHKSFISEGNEQGFQLSQSVAWRPSAKPVQCEAGGSYFHTDSYDTRVYSYERGLLYTFSFPSSYGHGVHAYLWGSWSVNKLFTVIVKYVYTGYFDRETVSVRERRNRRTPQAGPPTATEGKILIKRLKPAYRQGEIHLSVDRPACCFQ